MTQKSKNKFFEGLKAGLQDIIDYQSGKPMKLRSTMIEVPEPIIIENSVTPLTLSVLSEAKNVSKC